MQIMTSATCSNHDARESVIVKHNNVGIQHIKRNEYNDAIRHFDIALKYVKTMLGDAKHDDHGDNIPIISSILVDEEEEGEDIFSLSTMTMAFGSLLTACSNTNDESSGVSLSSSPTFQSIRLVQTNPTNRNTVSTVSWNNYDEKMLETTTTIILYNMATCYIGIMREFYDSMNDHNYKGSIKMAYKMLKLAYGMIKDILSSFTNINIGTIQFWYSIHQIEYRVLNAMAYVVFQQHEYINEHSDHHYHHTDYYLTSFECILSHIQQVQQILDKYKEMTQFLGMLSCTKHTAECA